jgi:hypothetical protein
MFVDVNCSSTYRRFYHRPRVIFSHYSIQLRHVQRDEVVVAVAGSHCLSL